MRSSSSFPRADVRALASWWPYVITELVHFHFFWVWQTEEEGWHVLVWFHSCGVGMCASNKASIPLWGRFLYEQNIYSI